MSVLTWALAVSGLCLGWAMGLLSTYLVFRWHSLASGETDYERESPSRSFFGFQPKTEPDDEVGDDE